MNDLTGVGGHGVDSQSVDRQGMDSDGLDRHGVDSDGVDSGGAATVAAVVAAGPYQLVIWDFDGVLANSEPVQARAYQKVLQDLGIHPEPDFFIGYIGHTESEIWTLIRQRYAVPDEIGALRERRRGVFLAEAQQALRPNAFVRPMLDAFARQGARQWIVSSGNIDVIRVLLAIWTLDSAFDKIVAFDPESPIPYSKTDELTAAVAGGGERVLAIEDNERYLRLAASLGAKTVGVKHEFNTIAIDAADFFLQS